MLTNIICFVVGMILGILGYMLWSWITDIMSKARIAKETGKWAYKKLGGTGSVGSDAKIIKDKLKKFTIKK